MIFCGSNEPRPISLSSKSKSVVVTRVYKIAFRTYGEIRHPETTHASTYRSQIKTCCNDESVRQGIIMGKRGGCSGKHPLNNFTSSRMKIRKVQQRRTGNPQNRCYMRKGRVVSQGSRKPQNINSFGSTTQCDGDTYLSWYKHCKRASRSFALWSDCKEMRCVSVLERTCECRASNVR